MAATRIDFASAPKEIYSRDTTRSVFFDWRIGSTMTPAIPPADAARETTAAHGVDPGAGRPVLMCPAPGRIFALLLVGIGLLVLAGIASSVLKFTFGYRSALGFIKLFYLDGEANVPTWFSSLLLFSNAILLGLIAMATTTSRSRWRWHWGGLALVFVALSLDEVATIHERTVEPIRSALDLNGVFYFAWVLPAVILLLVFAGLYLRFVLALPRTTRWLFVSAGSVYVLGAVGFEMIGGAYASEHGVDDLAYALLASSEEALEMIGLAIFFYALAHYIRSHYDRLVIGFDA